MAYSNIYISRDGQLSYVLAQAGNDELIIGHPFTNSETILDVVNGSEISVVDGVGED